VTEDRKAAAATRTADAPKKFSSKCGGAHGTDPLRAIPVPRVCWQVAG
jgi:hypothetical protein